ncbi:hypothetical protein [Adhaeribacter aquaticus]|uniref:hypothetical protein n=1 Tax=Adhaeribacter aquaticus TaxID=299567 RepID=UPI00047C5409|nr:hypothetical protein [Adhaeribacter aquaticus]
MARLNKKSTKNAIVKLLKETRIDHVRSGPAAEEYYQGAEAYLRKVAVELEIEIKPEDYK